MPAGVTNEQIPAQELNRLLHSDACALQLVDVRTPLEFDSEHIEGSVNIPLDELAKRGSEIKRDRRVILICRSGMRAGRAATTLSPYGYDATVLTGGVTGWKKVGLPLKEGKKRLPLERQVQLTIGLILLSSVAAGTFLNKWFYLVPGFIGCGLTFAGLTGNCGLALLLARAPWNKLEPAKSSEAKAASSAGSNCCS